jgi:hypothetical protein
MDPHKTNVGVAFGTLLATTGTLLCCVLPAVLVSAFPQLVWLSEHKVLVFGIAAGLLLASGFMIRRARRLPCPVDPVAARSCTRLRRISAWIYGVSVVAFAAGAVFAFVLPVLMA